MSKDATLVNFLEWMQEWKQKSITEPTKIDLLAEYQTMKPGLFLHLKPRQLRQELY